MNTLQIIEGLAYTGLIFGLGFIIGDIHGMAWARKKYEGQK